MTRMNIRDRMVRLTTGAAVVAGLTVGMAPPTSAALYQVGFLLDSSGSITAGGWTTITSGLSSAISQFVGLPDSYELSVMSFSSTTATIVAPTVLTAGNLAAVQALVTGAAFLDANTNFNLAFTNMTTLMNPGASAAAASYINFATDGVPNEGGNEAGGIAARDLAIAAGIDNISVEGIGGGVNVAYLTGSICSPQPCDTTVPLNFPAQGFYLAVASPAEYDAAVQNKIAVITNVPEPASVALLGAGLIAIGAVVRRRSKEV